MRVLLFFALIIFHLYIRITFDPTSGPTTQGRRLRTACSQAGQAEYLQLLSRITLPDSTSARGITILPNLFLVRVTRRERFLEYAVFIMVGIRWIRSNDLKTHDAA